MADYEAKEITIISSEWHFLLAGLFVKRDERRAEEEFMSSRFR